MRRLIKALLILQVCQVIGFARSLGAGEAKPNWQAEWDRTVRAAEQEGQVMVSIGGYGAIIDSGVFQKLYPKIKITHITGAGTDLTQRISAERRAGKYLVDVYNGGGNSLFQVLYLGKMLDPIKSTLILPDVTDATKWWEGKQKYADKEGQYIFVYEGNVSAGAGASYNSQLLDPREYKSYWDLLNPKLKGKILSTDIRKVRGAGIPWQFLYYNSDLGPKYLRRLFGEMELTFSRDYRQATDWLAQKRFALFLFSQSDDTLNAKEQGLPVQILDTSGWKEGVGLDAIGGAYALMDKPPHPNAAKILINWLLSRDGQIALQRDREAAGRTDSLRIDIPKNDVLPLMRRREGVKYLLMWNPEWMDMKPVQDLISQVMGDLKK